MLKMFQVKFLVAIAFLVIAIALIYAGARHRSMTGGPEASRVETSPPRRHRYVLVLDLDETLAHYDQDAKRVTFRPHVNHFLREADRSFDEIVLFTAALREYADEIVDSLERASDVKIPRRYYRESCAIFDGNLVKDLRVLRESQSSRVFIVDNTPGVFVLQPQCGLQIPSFYGDPEDDHLISMLQVLNAKITHLEQSAAVAQ